VRRLALVVISHLHADHLGGLAGALRGRSVSAVAIGPGRSPPWAFAQVLRTATLAHVPVVALQAGQRMSWPGLALDVLAPLREPIEDHQAEVDGTAVNDTSVVLRATTSAGRVLLTGDVELGAQADLLASRTDLHADVLKVPHHGSRFNAGEFLAAVRPRVAIVSVGAHNRYGHPSQHILNALTRAGTRVMRTDLSGDIAVVGGSNLQVVPRGIGADPR
jgi:competence protein ComEC